MMNRTDRKRLETALKRLEKCGGDFQHCEKCHIYTTSTPKALYIAVGCDLLPSDMFDGIADTPSRLRAEAIETVKFELS